jgi:hypothetical protein
VPVYDAQEVHFDMKTDLDKLEDILPRFDGEVPAGSCIAVGHSVSSYTSKKDDGNITNVNLGTSILFVIVVGTPGS